MDDICAAAEISRSTFFRYFPTKEDALFGLTNDTGERLLAALAARPADETPWVAVRRVLDPRLEEITVGGEHARRLARLIANTPALGCLDAALVAWTSSDQPQPLSEILDRAMEAVG